MAISASGDQKLSLISVLKPFDTTFPSVSGEFSSMELGGWIHAGYTPEVNWEEDPNIAIGIANDKSFSLINLLKPFDVTFPSVSGGFSSLELGGWMHAGYTPDVELEPPEIPDIPITLARSKRIWHLRTRNIDWLLPNRTK